MNHVLVSVNRAGFLLVIGLCLLTAPLHAQNDPASIFKAKCAACHGADGSGNTTMGAQLKTPDQRSEDVQKLTDAELTDVITNGKNGKMPAWGKMLKPDEIKGLVGYIRTLASKKNKAK
jgi:mono/diheme cytochrome c family protein